MNRLNYNRKRGYMRFGTVTRPSRRVNKYARLSRGVPQLSSRLQTLGSGRASARVTYNTDLTGDVTILLRDIIGANAEFINLASVYGYFKLINISIVVMARNLQGGNDPGNNYIRMLWTQDSVVDITKDDSAKVVPPYLARTKVFNFRPPNAVLPLEYSTPIPTGHLGVLNYRDWVVCDDIYDENASKYIFPGKVQITANGTGKAISVKIEAKILFRQYRMMNSETLALQLEKLKLAEARDEIRKKEELNNKKKKQLKEDIKEEIYKRKINQLDLTRLNDMYTKLEGSESDFSESDLKGW